MRSANTGITRLSLRPPAGWHTVLRLMAVIAWFMTSAAALQAQRGLKEKADISYKDMAYARAMKQYERFLEKSEDTAAMRNLMECYHFMKEYGKEEKLLSKLVVYYPGSAALALRYAGVLLRNGRKEAATEWFEKFLALAPDDKRGKEFADFSRETPGILLDPSRFKVSPMTFNTNDPEFSAIPFLDGFLYCSKNQFSPLGMEYISHSTETPLLDILYIRRNDGGGWETPQELPADINSRFDEGPIYLTPDGRTLFFSRSSLAPAHLVGRMTPMFTYYCEVTRENGKPRFGEPHPLLAHPPSYMIAYPTLSPDGDWLYFVSDKAGGYGGKDIYKARMLKGWLQEPIINLGPVVNTPGNEEFPFFHRSGRLYFSSDGHGGFGGKDIFWTMQAGEDKWTEPVNLGLPMNSSADDFSYWSDSTDKRGYFSTNRNKQGFDDDVWEFVATAAKFCDCKNQKKENYCYKFKEERSYEELPPGLLFEWDFGDGTTGEGYEIKHCYRMPGKYDVKLNIIDKETGMPIFRQSSFELQIQEATGVFISIPDTIVAGESITCSGGGSRLPDLRIRSYMWDFGDETYSDQQEPKHTYRDTGAYFVRLMISGENESNGLPESKCSRKKIVVISPAEAGGRKWEAPLPGNENIEKKLVQKYESPGKGKMDYRIQIGTSIERIEPLPVNFRGLENVEARESDGIYRYYYGRSSELDLAVQSLKTVKAKGYDQAVLMGFQGDSLIPGQGWEDHWLPGDELRYTVISGILQDEEGKPLGGNIRIEDLVTGDSLAMAVVNSTTGVFTVKLDKGRRYGYYVMLEGFYPVSGNVDLRDPKVRVVQYDTLTALHKTWLDKGNPMLLRNLTFGKGETSIPKESWQELFRLAQFLFQYKDVYVQMTVHTDNSGDPYDNIVNSRRRAAEIEKFLVMVGVEPERVIGIGMGDKQPAWPNDTEIGRAKNNRVELTFIKREDAVKLRPKYGTN